MEDVRKEVTSCRAVEAKTGMESVACDLPVCSDCEGFSGQIVGAPNVNFVVGYLPVSTV
jgi:hypothetical protein